MNNKERLIYVAKKLAELKSKLVFVGGGIIGLLLDPDYLLWPRPSYDVDAIVEVYGLLAFEEINKQLRKLGFKHNMQAQIICRWEIDEIQVDIMPTDPKLLGFSNRWYKDAARTAVNYLLEENLEILLISAPYLLATKIEAFENRGRGDFFGSHDFEDLITILDGRKSIITEILQAPENLREYLQEKFKLYLTNDDFIQALPGHLSPYGPVAAARTEKVIKIITSIAGQGEKNGS